MNIFVYWNRRDHDSSKIYRFVKDLFENNKTLGHTVYCHTVFGAFNLSGPMLENLQKSDMAIFFTHGSEDVIVRNKKYEIPLISGYNAHLLKNKKVLAICCLSAKELGVYCTQEKGICDVFIGFKDQLCYAECGFNGELRGFIYRVYSNAFNKAFIHAIKTNCSSTQFIFMLEYFIRNELSTSIQNAQHKFLGDYAKFTFVEQSIKGLTALGNVRDPLFV